MDDKLQDSNQNTNQSLGNRDLQASVQALLDRAEITDTVNRITILADQGHWDGVEACFADTVVLDYTSLIGGTPATVTPRQIVTEWRNQLPGFDSTQHLVGLPLITLSGDAATCIAHFQATHRLSSGTGGGLWTLGGTYTHELRRTPQGWKVNKMTMTARWGDGNQRLPEEAMERIAQCQKSTHAE